MGIRIGQTQPDRSNNGGDSSFNIELPTPWYQRVVPKKSPVKEIAREAAAIGSATAAALLLLSKNPIGCLKQFVKPPGGGLETVIEKLENREDPSCAVKSLSKK